MGTVKDFKTLKVFIKRDIIDKIRKQDTAKDVCSLFHWQRINTYHLSNVRIKDSLSLKISKKKRQV